MWYLLHAPVLHRLHVIMFHVLLTPCSCPLHMITLYVLLIPRSCTPSFARDYATCSTYSTLLYSNLCTWLCNMWYLLHTPVLYPLHVIILHVVLTPCSCTPSFARDYATCSTYSTLMYSILCTWLCYMWYLLHAPVLHLLHVIMLRVVLTSRSCTPSFVRDFATCDIYSTLLYSIRCTWLSLYDTYSTLLYSILCRWLEPHRFHRCSHYHHHISSCLECMFSLYDREIDYRNM